MSIAFVKDTYGNEMVLKNCKKCDGLQLFEIRATSLWRLLEKDENEYFRDSKKARDYDALALECTKCGKEGGYIV